MKNHVKIIVCLGRDLLNNLLDIPTQDLSSTELKLLNKCKLNALELFKDILVISEKIDSRKSRFKKLDV